MNRKEETQVKFPYVIPADNEVRFTEVARLHRETRSYNKIFCELCSFPMRICVTQQPCQHNVCFTCFEQSPNDCKV